MTAHPSLPEPAETVSVESIPEPARRKNPVIRLLKSPTTWWVVGGSVVVLTVNNLIDKAIHSRSADSEESEESLDSEND